MERKFWFYKITNTINGKGYIGCTGKLHPSRRWQEHKRLAKKGDGFALHAAIRKYGEQNFIFDTIDSKIVDPQTAIAIESELISQHKTLVTEHGYNIIITSPFLTEEHRRLMSERTKETQTPEVRKKISDSLKHYYQENINSQKGKHHSELTKQKMHKKRSPEAIQRMRLSRLSRVGTHNKVSLEERENRRNRMALLHKNRPHRDLTAKKFGLLTAVSRDPSRFSFWKVKCDCGTEKYVRECDLFQGKIISCGCFKRRQKVKDLSGQKFGTLTVLCRNEDNTPSGQSRWNVRCDCGYQKVITAQSLKKSKRCGMSGCNANRILNTVVQEVSI